MISRPRCGASMKAGRVCARPAGHQGPHQSGEALRRRRNAQRERQREQGHERQFEYYLAHRKKILAAARVRDATLPGRARRLLGSARHRARRDGIPFDLTAEWVEKELASAIKNGCPLLGIDIRLDAGQMSPGSPSIDRFNPERGYTQENCWVISHRANTMKQNATLDFMRRILEYADTRFAVDEAV